MLGKQLRVRLDGHNESYSSGGRSRMNLRSLLWSFRVATAMVALSTCGWSLESKALSSDAQPEDGPSTMWVVFTAEEFAALQPIVPQNFNQGPPPATSDRESASNLFGMRFPWAKAILHVSDGNSDRTAAQTFNCRIRYDGDFTFMLAGASPKKPLVIELMDGLQYRGANTFRLHTMQFDPSMMREQTAAKIFDAMKVPVPKGFYTEVSLEVPGEEAQYLGLYSAFEAVDSNLLMKHRFSPQTVLTQPLGLQTIRDLGDQWLPYAGIFRPQVPLTLDQQQRFIALVDWISNSDDQQFVADLPKFFDIDELLRYLAANAILSNVTGFSGIGTNDYLCLDPQTNRFRLISAEFETALGSAALSGTPQQLAALDYRHPYSTGCPLFDRLLNDSSIRERYDEIVLSAMSTFFHPEETRSQVEVLKSRIAAAKERDETANTIRSQTLSMELTDFLQQRHASITVQLAMGEPGYIPSPPDLSGFGGPLNAPRGAQAPITEAQFVEQVRVPEGFAATLFASAPEVNYPVAIATEPSGAIYVASDEQGSLGTDQGGGKILRCVDLDRDGIMDSVTEFCRVDHVRGVLYQGGRVWVCHPPFLSVFDDDDGDGVADRSKQLVSGLTTDLVNTRGGDHTTNGIRMGIDGWIYIGDGDYGVPGAVGTDGSAVVLRGGGILRVRPDGSELELFASGLRNPFDIAIDPHLNMFTRDNTNDGGGWDTRVSQLFQTAEYGYPRLFANFSDEIMPTLGAYGNGGGTGSLYVEDDAWPAPLNRSLLTSDWGRSGLFHHQLTAVGPTFSITQDLLATIPRATGMDIDAEGNLYVASWWAGEASVYVGPHVGFITRIRPADLPARELPELTKLTDSQLVDLLHTEQAVVRFHAQGELIRRGSADVVVQLEKLCLDISKNLASRVAAIFALKQIQGVGSHPLFLRLLSDDTVREFSIRALTDRKSQLSGLTAETFLSYLDDPSPRVRAQALIALGRLGDERVAAEILPLADTGSEARPDAAVPHPALVIPHLAMRTLVELNNVEACLQGLDGQHWSAALRVLRSLHSQQAVDGLIERYSSQTDQEKREAILRTLIRLYQQETPYDGSWWGIRPDTTGPYFDPMTWSESEKIADFLLTVMSESAPATDELIHRELQRHQVRLPGSLPTDVDLPETNSMAIEILPVDPTDPQQIGNQSFERVLEQVLANKGDVAKGGVVFKNVSCAACHTSGPGQQPVGPHLADIGKRYQAQELAESILKPSVKIAQGYETQAFLMDDGRLISGFVIGENGRQILLRDSRGTTHRIPRDEIEQRSRQQLSSMPEGLVSSLKASDLADLIAYLQSL